MKFESKFGIGEIVCHDIYKNGELLHSQPYEIFCITFGKCNEVMITCRHPRSGKLINFSEIEIFGDPDFSQELGGYYNGQNKL